MASLTDVISYIHNHYPSSQTELSVERLIKLIYLADWKCAITYSSSMTNTSWKIRDFQPWMEKNSVEELIEVLAKIRIGSLLKVSSNLQDCEKKIIKFVIEIAKDKSEEQLNRLVHSTYPAIIQNNSDILNLSELASIYNQEFKQLLQKS